MFRTLSLATGLFCCLISRASDNPPLGARSLAMAGCGTAIRGDIWGIQNNASLLAFSEKIQAAAFYENRYLIPGLGSSAVAFAIPAKPGVFMMNMHAFSFNNLYLANKLAIGFAKHFGSKISASVQLDWIYTRFGNNYSASSTAVAEIGLYAEPIKNLSFGFHLFNPTRSRLHTESDYALPTVMRLGSVYRFSDKLMISTEAEKNLVHNPVIRCGIEYHPIDLFYLRLGAASNPGTTSFGAGLVINHVQIDLASSFHQELGFSPSLGLSWKP